MHNYCFCKDNLDDITKDYMAMVAKVTMNAGINNIAPLGCSGDDFVLYGKFIEAKDSENGSWHRQSLITFRNYCGGLEMLMTDKNGKFLTYTKSDGLSFENLIDEFYRQFTTFKELVCKDVKCTFDGLKFTDDAQFSEGFDMLLEYERRKQQ